MNQTCQAGSRKYVEARIESDAGYAKVWGSQSTRSSQDLGQFVDSPTKLAGPNQSVQLAIGSTGDAPRPTPPKPEIIEKNPILEATYSS